MMSGAPPAAGTVAVVRPDGETREVAGDVWFPNGMAITPDDTTLTVAESYVHRLTAFDITPDEGLSNRRVWAELGDAAPDGICLDAEGAVWYARRPPQALRPGPRGWRRAADDRGCFACTLGGDDGRTLFIVATVWDEHTMTGEGDRRGQVLTARVSAPHAGRP